MEKKIVFVGDSATLYSLMGLWRPFEIAKWKVEKVSSIADARALENVTAVVVFAYSDWYITDFNAWEKHPVTVWYMIPGMDNAPEDVTRMDFSTLPSQLFQKVTELVS